MTLKEFKEKYSDIDLMTQVVYPSDQGFETWICFHNYYERVLKIKVDVNLNIFSFDSFGNQVEHVEIKVDSDESIQYKLKGHGAGTGIVAVAAVPLISSAQLEEAPFVIKKPQTTGYYTLWQHPERGYIDSSHEWVSVAFSDLHPKKWHVCLPASQFVSQRFVIAYNSSANKTAQVKYQIDHEQSVAVELAPMSSLQIKLNTPPERDGRLTIEGPIGAPMTLEESIHGDIHIHHS